MTITNQGSRKAPRSNNHGGPRSYQPGRPPKGPSKLYSIRVGTPEQMAIIDAMSPDERLAKLTEQETK